MDALTQHRKDRLRKLIDSPPYHGSQSQFSIAAGLTRSRVAQLVADQHSFGERSAAVLARALNLPDRYFEQGFEEAQPMGGNVVISALGVRRVPLVSYVQAGLWAEVMDQFQPGDAEEWLLTDQMLGRSAFALEIRGNSMLPDFRPGDRVIIDPEVSPQPGDCVAAKNGDQEATFKKYKPRRMDASGRLVFDLVPLNDDFPTLSSDVVPIQIIGTMIEHRRYRRPS